MTDETHYTLEPRYILELSFSRTGTGVRVKDPTLIPAEMVGQAWDMMNAFIMDMIDGLQLEATDELFRELFIEMCYRLVYREMCTLKLMPIWEQLFKHDLEHPRKSRKKKEDL